MNANGDNFQINNGVLATSIGSWSMSAVSGVEITEEEFNTGKACLAGLIWGASNVLLPVLGAFVGAVPAFYLCLYRKITVWAIISGQRIRVWEGGYWAGLSSAPEAGLRSQRLSKLITENLPH